MPKKVSPLTDQQVLRAAPRESTRKLSDGGGLYVEISPTGIKTWRMKFVDTSGKETRITFGNYPKVSLELARSQRAVVRKILNDGLDPRKHFDRVQIGSQMSLESDRRLPAYMDKTKLASFAALAGREAVKRIETLAFPAFQRMVPEGITDRNLAALLEQIRSDRSIEVVTLLYDICTEFASTCLDAGIGEDSLIDAMTDARVMQRRSN
jgi:hypothetical protein